MRRIKNFFISFWQKIKPSRTTLAKIMTAQQMSAVLLTTALLGIGANFIFLGGALGFVSLMSVVYGIYYCVANRKKIYEYNLNPRRRSNRQNYNQIPRTSNVINNQSLINQLNQETYEDNNLFTQQEIEFLSMASDDNQPQSNERKHILDNKYEKNIKFIQDNLTCSIGAPNEFITNPVTVILFDQNNNKIINTYDRLNFLKSLEANIMLDPLSGITYTDAKTIKFGSGFPKDKHNSIFNNVRRIKQCIAEFYNKRTRLASHLSQGAAKHIPPRLNQRHTRILSNQLSA